MIETVAAIVAGLFVLLMVTLAVSACMLSSRISQDEERRNG